MTPIHASVIDQISWIDWIFFFIQGKLQCTLQWMCHSIQRLTLSVRQRFSFFVFERLFVISIVIAVFVVGMGAVLMTYRLGPREPGPLCAPCAPTPPSTLLYLDWGSGAREVGRLDCSNKPLVTTNTTSLGRGGGGWGVCSVWRGDAELLVTLQASPSGHPGVHACNASTGAPAWSGTGAPPWNQHSILICNIQTFLFLCFDIQLFSSSLHIHYVRSINFLSFFSYELISIM